METWRSAATASALAGPGGGSPGVDELYGLQEGIVLTLKPEQPVALTGQDVSLCLAFGTPALLDWRYTPAQVSWARPMTTSYANLFTWSKFAVC